MVFNDKLVDKLDILFVFFWLVGLCDIKILLLCLEVVNSVINKL